MVVNVIFQPEKPIHTETHQLTIDLRHMRLRHLPLVPFTED